eukprot:symbB.v1.2.024033.t1/scaffold2247.1/size84628/6
MVTVVVGSQSAPKLEAARQGFQRLMETVEITGVEAESGVSAQPMGFEETRLGALNRLKAARASAEGASADFCIAFEGGVEEDPQGMMACFAIVCVQFRDDDFISEAGASGVFLGSSCILGMVRLEVPRIPFHQESRRCCTRALSLVLQLIGSSQIEWRQDMASTQAQ